MVEKTEFYFFSFAKVAAKHNWFLVGLEAAFQLKPACGVARLQWTGASASLQTSVVLGNR